MEKQFISIGCCFPPKFANSGTLRLHEPMPSHKLTKVPKIQAAILQHNRAREPIPMFPVCAVKISKRVYFLKRE